MAINRLSQAAALGQGSYLWIVPPLYQSQWTKKLDWYLNFQISRSLEHKSPILSDELKKIIEDNKLSTLYEFTTKPIHPKPLLIASHDHLPNGAILAIELENNFSHWVSECYKHWQLLEKPSLRIFLPQNLSVEEFFKLWPKDNDYAEITLVNEISSESN